jgi:hypothetical protein
MCPASSSLRTSTPSMAADRLSARHKANDETGRLIARKSSSQIRALQPLRQTWLATPLSPRRRRLHSWALNSAPKRPFSRRASRPLEPELARCGAAAPARRARRRRGGLRGGRSGWRGGVRRQRGGLRRAAVRCARGTPGPTAPAPRRRRCAPRPASAARLGRPRMGTGCDMRARPRRLLAIAGDAVAGRKEFRRAVGVDVQQRAGLARLKPLERLALAATATRDTVALEDLPHRRAMTAGECRQTHRPPVRAGARLEDPLLDLDAQCPWTRLRHRPARAHTTPRWHARPPRPAPNDRARRTQSSANTPSHRRSRAPSRRREGARPSRAWHAVRTCTYRLSCVRPSRWALRWLAPLSLRRRPDTTPS